MEMKSQKLVVMIPVLNEEKTIAQVIHSIPNTVPGVTDIQILVVNDGSTDNTVSLAKQAGAVVVSHSQNMGVGAAFHTGIQNALKLGADIIVNIDGDGQFNPDQILTLIKPIQDKEAGFVTASRFADPALVPEMPAIKLWGNRQVARMVNMLTGKKFTDVSCGFRAYSRDTALKMVLFGHFTYTHETFLDLVYKQISIKEIPLKVRGEREHGKSRVASNLWKFAIKSATIMFRAARDYRPFYFFGIPGITLFGVGTIGGIFLLIHYIQTGQTSPFRSLVTVSGVFIIVGFLLFFLSMLADMLYRNRVLTEEALYLARKSAYSNGKSENNEN